MANKFITLDNIRRDTLDWGTTSWISAPEDTGAAQLVVIEVGLQPGKGHDFHRHPGQEESIYVISGEIEQWVGQEKRILRPGEAAFIPADVVHASFNVSDSPAKLMAILSPCIGSEGYQLEEVHDQAPWNGLRG